jgi:hypothetical protein
MKKSLQKFIRKCESGMDVTFTAMSYTMLLLALLALVYEFGRLTYISSVSYNAARVAAQEAAKNIDWQLFQSSQEIFFTDQSLVTAQTTYDALTDTVIPPPIPGKFEVYRTKLPNGQKFIRIQVQTMVTLPVLDSLSLASIPPVMLTVEAYAEPAYGIDEETQ